MQPLEHNPGAIGVGIQVVANGARGLATGMAATTEASALVPQAWTRFRCRPRWRSPPRRWRRMRSMRSRSRSWPAPGSAYVEAAGIYDGRRRRQRGHCPVVANSRSDLQARSEPSKPCPQYPQCWRCSTEHCHQR